MPKPITASVLARIKQLQSEADALRSEYGISAKNSIVFSHGFSASELVVVADGSGGADLISCEGSYREDYTASEQCEFSSERTAIVFAELLVDDEMELEVAFGEKLFAEEVDGGVLFLNKTKTEAGEFALAYYSSGEGGRTAIFPSEAKALEVARRIYAGELTISSVFENESPKI